MKRLSYPTVERVLSALHYPNLQQIFDESDRITRDEIKPLDGLENGLHIFDQDLNAADTEPDMGMNGMGLQINRMGG